MVKPITIKIPFVSLKISVLMFLVLNNVTLFVQAQSSETVVATVNNRKITQQEVDNTVLSQLLPLEQQIYALRKAALENYILRILLEDEAKRRGITVEELKKQLTAGKIEISTSQIEQAYLENASAFAQMSPDEAKERIRLDMETQARMRNYRAAVSKLRENARVEIQLKKPVLSSAALNDNAPSIGDKNAKVTIIEFSDFQCPFCKEVHPVIKQVLQNYGNDVKFVFKHLPLSIHRQAFSAAQAAFCAGEQEKFWQYHDALFSSEDLSAGTLDNIAARLNLDTLKFKSCIKSDNSRNAVLRDLQEAKKLGIDGTPAFIINGKLFRGVLSFEDFKNIIGDELKSAQTQKN